MFTSTHDFFSHLALTSTCTPFPSLLIYTMAASAMADLQEIAISDHGIHVVELAERSAQISARHSLNEYATLHSRQNFC